MKYAIHLLVAPDARAIAVRGQRKGGVTIETVRRWTTIRPLRHPMKKMSSTITRPLRPTMNKMSSTIPRPLRSPMDKLGAKISPERVVQLI